VAEAPWCCSRLRPPFAPQGICGANDALPRAPAPRCGARRSRSPARSAISACHATEDLCLRGHDKQGSFVERQQLELGAYMSYTGRRNKWHAGEQLRRGLVKWMTENAITIAALEQLVTDRRVDQCVAFQQADGWFIVLVKLTRERDIRFLATFRELGKPRRFSRLDVLFKLLHDTLGYSGVIQVLPYSRAGVAKRLGAL